MRDACWRGERMRTDDQRQLQVKPPRDRSLHAQYKIIYKKKCDMNANETSDGLQTNEAALAR